MRVRGRTQAAEPTTLSRTFRAREAWLAGGLEGRGISTPQSWPCIFLEGQVRLTGHRSDLWALWPLLPPSRPPPASHSLPAGALLPGAGQRCGHRGPVAQCPTGHCPGGWCCLLHEEVVGGDQEEGPKAPGAHLAESLLRAAPGQDGAAGGDRCPQGRGGLDGEAQRLCGAGAPGTGQRQNADGGTWSEGSSPNMPP